MSQPSDWFDDADSYDLTELDEEANEADRVSTRDVRFRRDWWRFWFATIPDHLARGAVSVTLRCAGRAWTIGYRRKGWID